ncbi:MAG: hypothetical protein V2I51_13885 [Anderseniella sp.]|jgi:hypothetical protein|nr:hypothetical protein [Anderseniella sp.]
MKNNMNIVVFGVVIAFASVVISSMALPPTQPSIEPHFTVIYKDPDGAWPDQNNHGNAKSNYAHERPSTSHQGAATPFWNI